MRYEAGYKWNSLQWDNHFSIGTRGPLAVVTEFATSSAYQMAIAPISERVIAGYGWNQLFPSGISDGRWICIEVHLKMDTNGSDGVGEIWIDGVLRASRKDVNYSNNNELSKQGWTYFYFDGNQHNPSNGKRMYVDWDDIVVRTSYIGPTYAPPAAPTGLRTVQ
jgi:hypothetical protein